MNSINVLVLTPFFDRSLPRADEAILRQISHAVPGIHVEDGSALFSAEMRGEAGAREKMDALLAGTDVIFGMILPPDIVRRAPRLQWVQMMSAGVDRLLTHEIWQSNVIITGVSGIHAEVISEYVLGTMLMFAKNSPQGLRNMQQRAWKRYSAQTLRGRTVGIVGLGHIGREVARLAKAFGMNVVATRRSAQKAGRARYVETLYPQKELKKLLSVSDYVVLCVPLTPQTQHLIGGEELAAMKASAYIINIARGGIIDEPALIRALQEKRIAGAGLDVTSSEPLPPESPLWELENVILTPHISGGMEDYARRSADIFCQNLQRYRAGKKLLNRVDRQRGY